MIRLANDAIACSSYNPSTGYFLVAGRAGGIAFDYYNMESAYGF